MCSTIDEIAEDLKQKLEENGEQLLFGVEKFTSRYRGLKQSIPLLLHFIGLGGPLEELLRA